MTFTRPTETMYINHENPKIEVCIHFTREDGLKVIQGVTVKMMDTIKMLYSYDAWCDGGSLKIGIQHAINGTMPKIHKIDENLFQWISQVFWGKPDAWRNWVWNEKCPYFN